MWCVAVVCDVCRVLIQILFPLPWDNNQSFIVILKDFPRIWLGEKKYCWQLPKQMRFMIVSHHSEHL